MIRHKSFRNPEAVNAANKILRKRGGPKNKFEANATLNKIRDFMRTKKPTRKNMLEVNKMLADAKSKYSKEIPSKTWEKFGEAAAFFIKPFVRSLSKEELAFVVRAVKKVAIKKGIKLE